MKKLSVVCLMVVASIFMVTHVYAAASQVGAGSNELFAQLTFKNTSIAPEGGGKTYTTSSIYGALGYGRFVTDQLQLGVSFNGNVTTSDTGGSSTTTGDRGIDLYLKYHFMSKGQTFVPYLGIQGGYISSDAGNKSSGSAGSYGAMGGIKYFFTENTALSTELNYRRYQISYSGGGGEFKATMDDIQLLLGLSYFF